MQKRLAITLFLCVVTTYAVAQNYTGLVKQLTNSRAFADWIIVKRTGRPVTMLTILRDAQFHLKVKGTQSDQVARAFYKDSKLGKSFTRQEQDTIVTELLSDEPAFLWSEEYIPGAKVITGAVDSIMFISGPYVDGVYFLSRPVFLRGNSLAVLSYVWMRGGSGHMAYKTFRKETGLWIGAEEFSGGDW